MREREICYIEQFGTEQFYTHRVDLLIPCREIPLSWRSSSRFSKVWRNSMSAAMTTSIQCKIQLQHPVRVTEASQSSHCPLQLRQGQWLGERKSTLVFTSSQNLLRHWGRRRSLYWHVWSQRFCRHSRFWSCSPLCRSWSGCLCTPQTQSKRGALICWKKSHETKFQTIAMHTVRPDQSTVLFTVASTEMVVIGLQTATDAVVLFPQTEGSRSTLWQSMRSFLWTPP